MGRTRCRITARGQAILTEGLRSFPQSEKAMPGKYLKLGNDPLSLIILQIDAIKSEHLSNSILEKPSVAQILNTSTIFYGNRDSLPCSQKPSSGHYTESYEPSPYHAILRL